MRKKNKKDKLKVEDIEKNTSKDISHTIFKIKENERKYTVLLVVFFLLLFFVIGFISLRIKTKNFYELSDNLTGAYLSSSSRTIILDSDNKMSDGDGLLSSPYEIKINNTTKEAINYKVVFVEDSELKRKCGCTSEGFNISDIRYSLDGKTVSSFVGNEMIISTGYLDIGKSDTIDLRIWLDSNSQNNGHFHGEILFEKIEV